ncbi:hypothetical protein N0B16_02160 [Chryseobacterium sp. GMJ5]|uniref:C1q domain-containing protein n=1 Tax=Chryseobacterium gilvum TaxID=2976534 RepID=A0ABT2VTB7_9FLAO|nr:hypothetical protein [Chryseobacterium gilvum]MCU7613227.1 hypothetical protein [Chryseobacterium gilvum]
MKKYISLFTFGLLLQNLHAQVGIFQNNSSYTVPKITLAITDDDTGIQRNSTDNISFFTGNLPRITLDNSGNVGFNQNTPLYPLDINANNNSLKFQNLKSLSASDLTNFLVINASTSEIGVRANPSSLGQFIRLPFVDKIYNTTITDLDFTAVNDTAPNGANNVINTISGSAVNDGSNTIFLPEGVYSLNLKLVGIFKGLNDNNTASVHFLVNNNLYAYQPGIVSGYGGEGADGFSGQPNPEDTDARKTADFQEVLSVPAAGATINFKLEVNNSNFHLYKSFIPLGSSGNSSRTVLTINRLK